MAKPSKKKIRRYHGKSKDEWKSWGENFGKYMEQRGKEFGEEIGNLGKRFGEKAERKGKKWEEHREWFEIFGLIGPLIGSIFGIIFLAIGVLILNFINLPLRSFFIASVSNFVYRNLALFFAIFLFFGYTNYLAKKFPKTFWLFSPVPTSVGAVIIFWFAAHALGWINLYSNSLLIELISNFLYENLFGIFVIFLTVGYIVLLIKKIVMYCIEDLK